MPIIPHPILDASHQNRPLCPQFDADQRTIRGDALPDLTLCEALAIAIAIDFRAWCAAIDQQAADSRDIRDCGSLP
jgi:hypothetical protein